MSRMFELKAQFERLQEQESRKHQVEVEFLRTQIRRWEDKFKALSPVEQLVVAVEGEKPGEST